MADQIMVIEGVDGFSNLEGRGMTRDTMGQITEKLRSVASRREASVRDLEAKLNMMRKQLDRLDKTPGSREAHVKLYDEFVNLGKLHDLEKRLAIVTREKLNALSKGDMNEYKRLVMHERTLTKYYKSNKESGPRVARAVTAASAALKAKRAFVAGKDDARTANAAHMALVKSRAELAKQYKELKNRLRALSALHPSDDRNVELSRVQEALRVTRRGLAQTKKTVKAQRRFMEQRQFVQIGMEHQDYPRSVTASAVGEVEEVDESILSGLEVIEVDVNDLGGFMKDLQSAGKSFSKAKSEVDSFSKKVDDAQKAIGLKGNGSGKIAVKEQQLKTKKKIAPEIEKLNNRMRNSSPNDDDPKDGAKAICKDVISTKDGWKSVAGAVRSECARVGVTPFKKEPGQPGYEEQQAAEEAAAKSGMSTGAKIGIAIAALAAIGGTAFIIIKKKRAAGMGDSYAHDLYEND